MTYFSNLCTQNIQINDFYVKNIRNVRIRRSIEFAVISNVVDFNMVGRHFAFLSFNRLHIQD